MMDEILPVTRDIRYFADLQMFAADDEGRTEDPTDRKIQKAREEGQVPKSQEIIHVISLYLGALVAVITLPWFIGYEVGYLRHWFGNLHSFELSQASMQGLSAELIGHILAVLWPMLLVQVFVAIGGNILQVGWVFTWQTLQPKWNKIIPTPSKLFDRLVFGKTVFFNLAKSVMKLVGVVTIAWFVFEAKLPLLLAMWKMEPYTTIDLVVDLAYELTWKICLFLAILSFADYSFNRHQWKESLKMRISEVKDERKQAEGDPEVKRAQRRRMMEVARRRMMKEIPTADVIITNPTHYAVAVKYDAGMMTAPKVVAKGEGFIALRIREIAAEHGVPLYENKPLAQALFRGVEIGSEIPPQFYGAVAEVLAYVYRLKKKAV